LTAARFWCKQPFVGSKRIGAWLKKKVNKINERNSENINCNKIKE
jgi:hypothetical protein